MYYSLNNAKGFFSFLMESKLNKILAEDCLRNSLIQINSNMQLLKGNNEQLQAMFDELKDDIRQIKDHINEQNLAERDIRLKLLEEFTMAFKINLREYNLTLKQKILLFKTLGILEPLVDRCGGVMSKVAKLLSILTDNSEQNYRTSLPQLAYDPVPKMYSNSIEKDLAVITKLLNELNITDTPNNIEKEEK